MKIIKIALLGLGTIGTGVLQIIKDHQDKLFAITGSKIEVKRILVSHINKQRNVNLNHIKLTQNINEIVNDKEIQIVVEVMGTVLTAKKYIEKLLGVGKNIITANKDLLALYGTHLIKLAQKKKCDLYYEASVAGGIPILRTIVNSFAADKIVSVRGILNGTTNYILTKMTNDKQSYKKALLSAQKSGYAETNPINDISGQDAAYKMIILTRFAFGMSIGINNFKITGIKNIEEDDIKQAQYLGYVIKLLGTSQLVNNHLNVSVEPLFVPKSHPLASINYENNAILVSGAAVGQTVFYGPGAGKFPTANSVLSDLIAVTKNIALHTTGTPFNSYIQNGEKASPKEIKSPYYFALEVKDHPGQMAKITKIMGDTKVSLHNIIQTELNNKYAKIITTTYKINEVQLQNILKKIKLLKGIKLTAHYKILDK